MNYKRLFLLTLCLVLIASSSAYAAGVGDDLPINPPASRLSNGMMSFLYIMLRLALAVLALGLIFTRRWGLLAGVGAIIIGGIIGLKPVEVLNYFSIAGSLF